MDRMGTVEEVLLLFLFFLTSSAPDKAHGEEEEGADESADPDPSFCSRA